MNEGYKILLGCDISVLARVRVPVSPGGLHVPGPDPGSRGSGSTGVVSPGAWGEWGQSGACSLTCGAGTRTRYRDCGLEGMCTGDFREEDTCDAGECRELRKQGKRPLHCS